jgi:hypothetical protein
MRKKFWFAAFCWFFQAAFFLYAGGSKDAAPSKTSAEVSVAAEYGFSPEEGLSWVRRPGRKITFDSGMALAAAAVLLCVIGLSAAIRGIGGVFAEKALINADIHAIITGDLMPREKKERAAGIKKRGLGLRFKIAAFTMALSLLVVLMVSVPFYYMITRSRRETLLRGLWDRSTVLLDGLATSVQAYLLSGNEDSLSYLPGQADAIPEAPYVTITGCAAGENIFGDYVWATNDPNILSKIDTPELRPGVSRLTDALSPRLDQIIRGTDGWRVGSEPEFSPGSIPQAGKRGFIFFKPLIYRRDGKDDFFWGLIRTEVFIDSIVVEIAEGQRQMLRIIAIVALAAQVIGIIGALVFSALIIRPIRKLARHVEIIRDTQDKARLAGLHINIATNDELAVLGDIINAMTRNLAQAAAAASDLSIGKEIQKKFIPLDLGRDGSKLSTGFKDTPNARFFGYYEGAKGVSGDYFDYLDLDGRYYAIIKCDVAGKGVSASFIMIQVATMFRNYFKKWKPAGGGMLIEELVYQINDFFENMGFKDRFAAFTLCLFDSETGLLRFCNAGDNLIHFFDASDGRFKTITLPRTPVTGVVSSSLVKSRGGYEVQTLTIDHGDILVLYTDGIEEAKRKFRDSKFREIICAEGPDGTAHGNHVAGQGVEEFGSYRVEQIVNAVMNGGVFTLRKWHNGEGPRQLNFNFSSCGGGVEDLIMALVSVEKMFRCYRDPKAGEDSRVPVDKKIDAFLKAHFLQYRDYCSRVREYPGSDAYMYYTHVKEDEQYDDLTILGIKRK